MKKIYTGIHRMCMFSVLLLLFAFQLFPLSAYAAGYVTLNSFSGPPGVTLNVSGGGFNANEQISLLVGESSKTPQKTTAADASGNFSDTVIVPGNTPQGPLTIIASGMQSGFSTNSYYVVPLSPTISVNAPSHAPYGVVTISGSNFANNESITISLAGTNVQVQANSNGSFSDAQITVPAVSSGLYHLTVKGDTSGAEAIDYFWIDTFYPSVMPSTYYLLPGATLSFTGSGFAANETIEVREGSSATVLSSFSANSTGSFDTAGGFAVPTNLKGTTRTFTLKGTQSNVSASTNVTVGDFYAYVSPSAYWLLPEAALTFTGGGFAANETVDVYRGSESTPIANFTTGEDGGFMNIPSLTVPADAANGSVTYRFIGNLSNAQAQTAISVGQFYPSISPSEYYVQPNATIDIFGSGFAANEKVTLYVNNQASTTVATTDANGNFDEEVFIPFGNGSATVYAQGAKSKTLSSVGVTLAQFYPSINPSSYYVFPGDEITYSGSGFVANETVTISVNGTTYTIDTDENGNFESDEIMVPFSNNGSLVATFTGNLSQSPVSSTVTIGALFPYLSATDYFATPGKTIKVSGSAFAANETVTVKAGSFSTETTASASGTTPFVSITIPFQVAQSLPVTFTGNQSGATASVEIAIGGFSTSLTADNYYSSPGSTIMLSGSGFAPNEEVMLSTSGESISTTADENGAFSNVEFTLPFEASASSLMINATGESSNAMSSLTISLAPFAQQVSPSTYYTQPGSQVTFTGSGFAKSETVTIKLGESSLGTVTTNTAGGFTHTLTIPYSNGSNSTAHFTFTGSKTLASIPVDITLAPFYTSLVTNTYYGNGGSPITISGSGFAGGEQVKISFDGESMTTVTADTNGAFSYSGAVPFSPAGNRTFKAEGVSSGAMAVSPFTVAQVYTSVELGSYAGAKGSAVQITGSGFLANEPIEVTTDRTSSTVVHSFNASASGTFNNSGLIIPTTFAEGNLTITVTGKHSFDAKSIVYYVTGE